MLFHIVLFLWDIRWKLKIKTAWKRINWLRATKAFSDNCMFLDSCDIHWKPVVAVKKLGKWHSLLKGEYQTESFKIIKRDIMIMNMNFKEIQQ